MANRYKFKRRDGRDFVIELDIYEAKVAEFVAYSMAMHGRIKRTFLGGSVAVKVIDTGK